MMYFSPAPAKIFKYMMDTNRPYSASESKVKVRQ